MFKEVPNDGLGRQSQCQGQKNESVMKQAYSFIKNNLKVGTDMTKTTIPTSFVMPESFLVSIQQNTAVYSHLLTIADSIQDPEKRFLQVLKFHLIWPRMYFPRNPLNPTLGEVYHNQVHHMDESTNKVIPGDVTRFVSEQVSHHPPISAFHFENAKHDIQYDSSQQITPVFTGKNIRAQMDVRTSIKLGRHNNTYINDKFPDGYLRLLRWKFEFSGKYTFMCPETGHRALIHFKDKPFLGGKWHELHIYVSRGKDTLYEITGSHVDTLHITNLKDKKSSVFINYNTMRREPIVEPSLDSMEANNSIRVWKGVYDAFADQDVRRAGLEKHRVEEAERKKLQQPDLVYDPVHFKLVDHAGEANGGQQPCIKYLK
ncbi:hypothetical protein SAMD00019534_112090 [Acytostelium subglobosum LB1]|uniref:hypothetical protein n=1 Tax=Acytostelium subglobosum LB1 TaxID=1410327 RepID=UPI000644FD69|nr:hypothetical protein SAMD00019534_112090 [Acytostelium subglobosum LB1]GAM28033.1 hypothetical protein SAMD00019534_112090 [Acytostelium subglobosum LB1]|eukprot:XP_012748992.1 hypothetical protein SAMD00019534_112090 [Acytostelium subglobosum LB1]